MFDNGGGLDWIYFDIGDDLCLTLEYDREGNELDRDPFNCKVDKADVLETARELGLLDFLSEMKPEYQQEYSDSLRVKGLD